MRAIAQFRPTDNVDIICKHLDKTLNELYSKEEIDTLGFGVDTDFDCSYAWNIHDAVKNISFKLQFVKRTGSVFQVINK